MATNGRHFTTDPRKAELQWRIEMAVTNDLGFTSFSEYDHGEREGEKKIKNRLRVMDCHVELNKIPPTQMPYIPPITEHDQRPRYRY